MNATKDLRRAAAWFNFALHWTGSSRFSLVPIAASLAAIAILTLLGLGFSAAGVDSAPKPTLSFNLAATNGWFERGVGKGLRLRVERDELGWEVCVYKKGSTDNLLLPRGNWHGPQLCQIYTWMPRDNVFGNNRLMPIQSSKQSVRIRITGATASGRPGSERFTGGRADIYLEP